MRTAALVYAGSISPHALSPLAGGASAFGRSLAFARSLPGVERVIVAEGSLPLPRGDFARVSRESWTVDSLLGELAAAGEGAEAVFLVWGDLPFLDPALAARMLESYGRYRAEYGFADGYPVGLAAEILSPRILPNLRSLAASIASGPGAASSAPERESLFAVVQKDINSFDIETEISPKDLRDLRLVLACDSRRDRLLVERLMEAGVRDEASVLSIVPRRLDLLRTLPAFVQVQVSGGCPQACSLCPWPTVGGDILARRDYMAAGRFASLMDQVEALCGDAVVDISLWGEPALNPEIGDIVREVLGRPALSLIVETSGLGWDRDVVEGLAALGSTRLDWVVSLDAPEKALYERLRGPGWEEAQSFAARALALFPGRVHLQTLRVRENESSLESFWRGWKKQTDNVIVQKYSTFAGFLPERKVCDLSPLLRRPCWHLKRDLAVLLDGTVPLCRECARGEIVLGSAFGPGGLEAAWKAGDALHLDHVAAGRGESSRYPEPCTGCDEYYTYNA